MTVRRPPWHPSWESHPGEMLREKLQEMGLTQKAAAERLGIAAPEFNGLVTGARRITPMQALRLEDLTGISARMWLHSQADYDLSVERARRGNR